MKSCVLFGSFALVFSLACTPPSSPQPAADVRTLALYDAEGQRHLLANYTDKAKLHVVLFFDADCPVLRAHDERIRALIRTFTPRGVSFSAVVSQAGADMARTRAVASERQLPLPVLEDRDARLADALGVEYSSHVVVLDPKGRVLYSGAIDSERTHLSASAQRWLERALDAALSGRPIERATTEPLGCPLSKH